MADNTSARQPCPPKHVKAFVVACAVGFIIPDATLVIGALVDLSEAVTTAIYLGGVLVVALLLVSWFVMYRAARKARYDRR